jgi:hypothetical protein
LPYNTTHSHITPPIGYTLWGLEAIKKNGRVLEFKQYDRAGRVYAEYLYNERGEVGQLNLMNYDHGVLRSQNVKNSSGIETSLTGYQYDAVGNVTEVSSQVHGVGGQSAHTMTHRYHYEGWDTYQQSQDDAILSAHGQTRFGQSRRIYDSNGLLVESIDQTPDSQGKSNYLYYWNSSIDGLKAREDRDGLTSYLRVNGKTIGDLRLDSSAKTQALEVYSGFTPIGSQQQQFKANTSWQSRKEAARAAQERATGDIADGTLPELPQDHLGAYTLQAGDTLEGIALQVYGDASLWYVIADANGLSERSARAGSSASMMVGKRLNLPSVAANQHHTSNTHKVLNSTHMLGNTNATTPLPLAPPPIPHKEKNRIWAKIAVGMLAAVAVLATAGAIGILAGGLSTAGGSIFTIGASVLGGSAFSTMGSTLSAGFASGFLGGIASQGIAKAFGLQESMDLKGALLSGLATAATAGIAQTLTGTGGLMQSMDKNPITPLFRASTAAQMLEADALIQGAGLATQTRARLDWLELGAAGVTGGVLGGGLGQKIQSSISELDRTGILSRQARALTSAAINSVTGATFDALQVLEDTLGDAVGSLAVETVAAVDERKLTSVEAKPLKKAETKARPSEKTTHAEQVAYQKYRAHQMEGYEAYGDLDGYEGLRLEYDMLGHSESGDLKPMLDYENGIYWNRIKRNEVGYRDNFQERMKSIGLGLSVEVLDLTAKDIWNIRAFGGTPIPGQKAGMVDAIERFVGFDRKSWSGVKGKQISNNLDNLQVYVNAAHDAYPNVPVDLVNAVIVHESRGTWNAVSKTGALGVMQLTADNYYKGKDANFNPFHVEKSIHYGVKMLSDNLRRFGSSPDGVNKALAAYNQGLGAINRAVREHGVQWSKYVKTEGQRYYVEIEKIRNNKQHIPGYFGEK